MRGLVFVKAGSGFLALNPKACIGGQAKTSFEAYSKAQSLMIRKPYALSPDDLGSRGLGA